MNKNIWKKVTLLLLSTIIVFSVALNSCTTSGGRGPKKANTTSESLQELYKCLRPSNDDYKVRLNYDGIEYYDISEIIISASMDLGSSDRVVLYMDLYLTDKMLPTGDSIISIIIPKISLSGVPYSVSFNQEFNYGKVEFNKSYSYNNLNGYIEGFIAASNFATKNANSEFINTKDKYERSFFDKIIINTECMVDSRELKLSLEYDIQKNKL